MEHCFTALRNVLFIIVIYFVSKQYSVQITFLDKKCSSIENKE
jgi:hypothetical protein